MYLSIYLSIDYAVLEAAEKLDSQCEILSIDIKKYELLEFYTSVST